MEPAPREREDPARLDAVQLFPSDGAPQRLPAEQVSVALPINYPLLGGADRQRVVPGPQCESRQLGVADVFRDRDRDGSDRIGGGFGLTQARRLLGYL